MIWGTHAYLTSTVDLNRDSSFPHVLAFEIDTDWDKNVIDGNLFYFPNRLLLNGQSFVLTSRIVSSQPYGYHFTSYQQYQYPTEGVYYFDDMSHNGHLKLVADGGALRGRQTLTTGVFYTIIQD